MNSSECMMNIDSVPGDVKMNIWCKLNPSGNLPKARVGHTAVYFKTDHKVVLIGGAKPGCLYDDVWILNLKTLKCSQFEVLSEFEPRYVHSAFCPVKAVSSEAGDDIAEATNTKNMYNCSGLWIFAGATRIENKNDIWELNFETRQWLQLSQSGEIPTPRTYHTTSAFLGDKFVAFSGGTRDMTAITDTQTYQLDTCTREWSILPTKGQQPLPRHGHVLVGVDEKLYCHGGVSGKDLYDDLHILDSDGTWIAVDCDHYPSKRTAHGAVCHKRAIYIFGGLGTSGTLNDMWRLHVDTLVWEEIMTCGSVPPRRFHFTLVLVELPHKFEKTQEQNQGDNMVEQKESEVKGDSAVEIPSDETEPYVPVEQKESEAKGDSAVEIPSDETEPYVPYILLHGGMDEKGNIYDDFYVMSLGSGKDVALG